MSSRRGRRPTPPHLTGRPLCVSYAYAAQCLTKSGGVEGVTVPLSAKQKRRLAAQEEAAIRKHVERTRGGGKAEADEKDEEMDSEEGLVGTAAARVARAGGSTARTEQSLLAFVQRAYVARLGRPRDVWGGGPPTRRPSSRDPSWSVAVRSRRPRPACV